MTALLLAEFATPAAAVGAVRALRDGRWEVLDAYSPFPVPALEEALALPRSRIPALVALGGLMGALTGYALQYYCNAVSYPLNVGGRPLHSAPAFIPITFELGVLLGALAAFLGVFVLAGLPRPHHPVFEVDRFRSASIDRFWVSMAAPDALGERRAAREELRRLGAAAVALVEEREGVWREVAP